MRASTLGPALAAASAAAVAEPVPLHPSPTLGGPIPREAWQGQKARDWKIGGESAAAVGARIDKARAKAKAARQARKAQRMRAKGKR